MPSEGKAPTGGFVAARSRRRMTPWNRKQTLALPAITCP